MTPDMTTQGSSPSKLITAIRASHLGGVLMALDAGADVNEPDMHGHAGLPLRTACFEGNLAIVRELLQHGANPNASASDGPGAAMRLALRRQHQDIVALLREHGAHAPDEQPSPLPITPSIQPEPEPESAVETESDTTGNLIEFTHSEIKYGKPVEYAPQENFGTETNALSADLLFLDEDEVPPIAWPTSQPK